MGVWSALSGSKNTGGYQTGTAKLVKAGKVKAAKAAGGQRSIKAK
jgi:hypothetical protein